MKNKTGIVCMVLGCILILCAAGLTIFNYYEDIRAGQTVEDALQKIYPQISSNPEKLFPSNPYAEIEQGLVPVFDTEMAAIDVDGYAYIGCLSFPTLQLELPVMSDWSYDQLKISPCRYSGSTKSDDIVIAAHNYTRHFGNLSSLGIDDIVVFTDVEGNVINYRVIEIEIIAPTAIEKVKHSPFDMVLFTCTYGGRTRLSVGCRKCD